MAENPCNGLPCNWEGPQGTASAEKEVLEGQQEFINPPLTCGDIGVEISREVKPFSGAFPVWYLMRSTASTGEKHRPEDRGGYRKLIRR